MANLDTIPPRIPNLKKLSKDELDAIRWEVGAVSNTIYEVLCAIRALEDCDAKAGIEALCEKAGYLSDRCAIDLCGVPRFGTWEEWAGFEPACMEAAQTD